MPLSEDKLRNIATKLIEKVRRSIYLAKYKRHVSHRWNSTKEERKIATRNQRVSEVAKLYRRNFSGAIFPGRRIDKDLSLYFESDEGRCEIPDAWPALSNVDGRDELTLHQRLAISNQAATIDSITTNCYITAALTFIISKNKYVPGNVQMRALTIAIDDPNYAQYQREGEASYAHAEEVLFHYLKKTENLSRLISDLNSQYSLSTGHKVYGLVLEIHSTYSMCDGCESRTYTLQSDRSPESFLVKMEDCLQAAGFVLPEVKKTNDILTAKTICLNMTTRVSAREGEGFSGNNARGHDGYAYGRFHNTYNAERNVALQRNAMVLHARDTRGCKNDHEDSYPYLEKYDFQKRASNNLTPSYTPILTVFAMMSDVTGVQTFGRVSRSARERAKVLQAKKWDAEYPIARFSTKNNDYFIRRSYKAKPDFFWKDVAVGDVSAVRLLIRVKRDSAEELIAMFAVKDEQGFNVYHKIAASGSLKMLTLIDTLMQDYLPAERNEFLAAEDKPLVNHANTPEIYEALLKLGAHDPLQANEPSMYNDIIKKPKLA